MKIKLCITIIALELFAGYAIAADFEMNGRASVSASGDPQTIKALAIRAAKKQAVVAGIDRIVGPDASQSPEAQSKIQRITDNINDNKIIDSKGLRVGADYEMVVTIVIDDNDFRNLITDAGLAANTNAVRAGGKILAVMDEFLTNPRDLKQPLEELTEFRSEKGKSFKDKSVAAGANSSAAAAQASSSKTVDAAAASNAKASGSYDSRLDASGRESVAGSARDGSGSVAVGSSREGSLSSRDKGQFSGEASSAASYKERNASNAASASAQNASSISAKNVQSEDHDNVYYKKLVKYQPQNAAPEKVSQTYNAMVGMLNKYDLQVADNDMFRSKYFKNKPITIEQMQNSEQLVKYVSFARSEAKADYFMVGTTIIIDSGLNPNSGSVTCTGVTTVKTYATEGAESIASTTVSEAAEGRQINECAGNLAIKLAAIAGAELGAAVQERAKKRTTYGNDYFVTLTGKGMTAILKLQFSKALKSIPGLATPNQRSSSDTELQYAVTFKGDAASLTDSLIEALSSNPLFGSLQTSASGNDLRFCLGPCGKVVKK